ncbi:hypothetical protein [Spiroplasma endosymbiont of Asaphidion curtum]
MHLTLQFGRIKNFHKEWIISFKTIYNWIYSGLLEKVTNKNFMMLSLF